MPVVFDANSDTPCLIGVARLGLFAKSSLHCRIVSTNRVEIISGFWVDLQGIYGRVCSAINGIPSSKILGEAGRRSGCAARLQIGDVGHRMKLRLVVSMKFPRQVRLKLSRIVEQTRSIL
jgi:hypothetical protein